jgi:hypothetical protein
VIVVAKKIVATGHALAGVLALGALRACAVETMLVESAA